MKFFIFKEVEGMFTPINKNLLMLVGKTHNVRETLYDNLIEMLYHSHFKYSKKINIADYLDEHRYGNDKTLISLNIRTFGKIKLWNAIIEHCTIDSLDEIQPTYLYENELFIRMMNTLSNVLSIDVRMYFEKPLLDPLAPEWKIVTDAICNYIGINFGITNYDIMLISDYSFELMDKELPSKLLAERLANLNHTCDDTNLLSDKDRSYFRTWTDDKQDPESSKSE